MTASQSRPVRRSIGSKLTLLFLALALLPMAGTAYYNVTQGQREVLQVTQENLRVVSQSVASQIDQLLIENQRVSATMAGDPNIVAFLSVSESERPAMQQVISATLENFAVTHPDYNAPGLIDAQGIVVASTNPALIGRDYSFRDYFTATIQGRPYISDISVGRNTNIPGFFFTNPVFNAEGEVVGMNIIRYMGESIWNITDNVTVGEEGITVLVDQDGVIIAHPDRSLLYRSLGALSPEAVAAISSTVRFGLLPDTQTPLIPESLGLDDLAAELAAGRPSGSIRYYSPLRQSTHVVGYTRLNTQPWTVLVDIPEAQFLAPMQRLGTVALLSVGAVAVITLIVSILLARGITRPISQLTRAAIAVENDQPFDPSDIANVTAGQDEIAHLGRVFSAMVLALRRRVSELRTVYQIGQDITAALEVEETLRAILDRVRQVVASGAAEITLYAPDEQTLIVTAWSGAEGFIDTTGKTYRLGEGYTGRMAQERRSTLVADIQADSAQKPVATQLAEGVTIHSLLGVPLLIRDRLVGTLELVSSRIGAFDVNDQRLLETIAPQAAIAIEKAQQVREREQKLRNQIEQLRIEIDQAKRERQVSAITETDYFQDLAMRAHRLRQRSKRKEEDTGGNP